MTDTLKPDSQWQKGQADGPNRKLLAITLSLSKLHRLNIEKKLSEMKAYVNAECAKLDHPAAREFAGEINKLKVE